MKKRLLSALAMCLSVFAMAFAEDVNYNGVVVAENGTPIMGATVSVTGTELSTMTDMDGKFSITIPNGYSAITISYAGMKRQTINVQRDPVILYPTNSDNFLGQERKQPRIAPNYKKDLFNLEVSYGNISGNLADYSDYWSENTDYFGVNLGWHHNYNEWFGWEVFNIGALSTRPIGDCRPSLYITTGVKLTTPSWKNMSLFTSLNIGAADASVNGEFDDICLATRIKFGVNFSKWVYVAYSYDHIYDYNYEYGYSHEYGYNYEYGYMPFRRHAIALGFNF